jgi:hypothetical protein
MSMMVNPHRFGADPTLSFILLSLALQAANVACLDIGDEESYPGTGQTISDTSGEGNDFVLGSTSASQTTDPTFHGVAGDLSEEEYLSFDGGDGITSAAGALTDWANGWSVEDGKWSMLLVFYYPGSGTAQLLDIGKVQAEITAGGKVKLIDQQDEFEWDSSNSVATGWNILILSGDEGGGASGSFINLNGTVTTGDAGIAEDHAGEEIYSIGSNRAVNGQFLPNGSRFAMFAAWNDNLSTVEAAALRSAIKNQRFPSAA